MAAFGKKTHQITVVTCFDFQHASVTYKRKDKCNDKFEIKLQHTNKTEVYAIGGGITGAYEQKSCAMLCTYKRKEKSQYKIFEESLSMQA